MTRIRISIIAATALFTTAAFAVDEFASVRESLSKALPNVTATEIRSTPIDGLFEVVAGPNIFYYHPKSEHLLFGELYTKEGKSLTQATKDAITAKKLADVDLSKAIKIGDGKNIVIEFTDPDCPFCRKSFEYWKTKTDVTHYVFLFPVASLHPSATAKAEWILSRKDHVSAFNDVLSGKMDNVSITEGITEAGKNLLKEQQLIGEKLNVSSLGTPLFFVNKQLISGANFTAIDQALAAGANTPAKN